MLRARLSTGPILVAPGVWDALSALLAERAGFECVFLSGAALSFTRLARPDFGLMTASELADTAARICDRVAVPLFVDADQGYGNALNLQRTVRMLERAGVAGVQIEDQVATKPLGQVRERPLVPIAEMVGRIKAAQDARISDALLISARTDAPSSQPFAETLRRCEAYLEAGCDLLFAEGIGSVAEAEELATRFGKQVPLVHNLLEGGPSPYRAASELDVIGYRLALLPGAGVGTMAKAVGDLYAAARRDGSTASRRGDMLTAGEVATLVGTPELADAAKRYL